jgi:hypothetical protein
MAGQVNAIVLEVGDPCRMIRLRRGTRVMREAGSTAALVMPGNQALGARPRRLALAAWPRVTCRIGKKFSPRTVSIVAPYEIYAPKPSLNCHNRLIYLVRPAGLEPATERL